MPDATRIANARKSRVRSAVEHVFAHEKGLMDLVRPHDRHCPSPREDRPRQPRLQHAPLHLARRAGCARQSLKAAR